MKKTIAMLVAAAMTVSAVPFAGAANDKDDATRGEVVQMLLNAADDYNPDVQKTDVIKGYEDGQLHEERTVTRAEALVMLKRAFGSFPKLTGHNLRVAIPKEDFTDIPVWAEDELAPVFDAGIVAGTATGIFSPNDNVTTEQMKLFIDRVYALYGTNPSDSYFASVDKELLETYEISPGRTMAGNLYGLMERVDEQVKEIIEQAAVSQPEKGSAQEKIKIYYNNIIDMDARNAAGYEPIKNDLAAIENVKSVSELTDISVFGDMFSALRFMAKFESYIDPDDSNAYISLLTPAEVSQNREIYTGEAEKQKQAYLKYITTLLTLCGESEDKAKKDAEDFFEFEKQISDASLPLAEQSDIEKTKNIYTLDQLKNIFTTVNLDKAFEESGLNGKDRILVKDAGKMEFVASALTDDNLETIKNYLKIALILNSVDYFGEDFRQTKITFSQEALGLNGSQTVEQEAASKVSDNMADYVGQLYAEKYCTDEMVAEVTDMIKDIMDVYRERIKNLTWMSDATKEKALLKLDNMAINVGAPDYEKVKSPLDNADLKSAEEGGSYFQNAVEILKANETHYAEEAKKPVDKTEWVVSPQMANAFYVAQYNSINFPAAFMQDPVYNINNSYEEKLGAVGFVIGHEMSHAFDSNGSQYDEKGNAVDWWTAEDKAKFKELCNDVINFYDGLESAPVIAVDGELTLTENIADLGAMACVVEIGNNTPGFDFKKMFESYSRLWAATGTREALQNRAYTDNHSPANVRIDRAVQSTDKFYEVYNITEKDGMYLPPEERVHIW